MKLQKVRLLLSATLLVVASSFARADTFTIDSYWHTGSSNNVVTYTGDGTFDLIGTTFSLIDFQFTNTTTDTVVWTATPYDGELLDSNEHLIIGNGSSDCNGASCITFIFGSAITTGSAPVTFTGISGTTQDPNTYFDSATLTDTHVPDGGTTLMLLGGVLVSLETMRRKLRV